MYSYLRRNRTTAYTECQAFSPVVRIGPPLPLHPQASVAPPPPPNLLLGGRHTCLREMGWGEPIQTKGRTLWYSSYSIIPLRTEPIRHKVPRIPQCMSPCLNWDPPPPPLVSDCVTPQNQRRRGHTRLRVRGWGGPNSDDYLIQ
jgi:hypothetical protein